LITVDTTDDAIDNRGDSVTNGTAIDLAIGTVVCAVAGIDGRDRVGG
jgi:hypothetical protein